ncbi:hypothetical protein L539_4015 [Bordetella hinzii 5132]|nr:hypothetical protein L539_4015 [Bordetella hinzii 5132]
MPGRSRVARGPQPCTRQRKASPAASGTSVVLPKGTSSGMMKSSRNSVRLPVLRGRP